MSRVSVVPQTPADLLPAVARPCLGLRARAFSHDGPLQMRMADARSVLRLRRQATKDTPVQGDESAGTRGAADTRTTERFLMSLTAKPASAGASAALGGAAGGHQEGLSTLFGHAFTLDPVQPVIQRDTTCFSSIEAPMEQLQLPGLLCRLDAPSVVPPAMVAKCHTYRDAVRLCWSLRKVRNMTRRMLAERAGLYAPHVTCYLADDDRKRSLPAEHIRSFELACDNTAITQWLAMHAQLTVLEEMQAARRAA